MQTFDSKSFLSLIDNDTDLAKELIQLFLTDCPQLLMDLEVAQKKGDSRSIEKLSHRLKGGLKIFFAQSAVDLANELETLGRLNKLENSLPVMQKLTTCVEQVVSDLQKLNSELANHV